jgi:hypothetical protein
MVLILSLTLFALSVATLATVRRIRTKIVFLPIPFPVGDSEEPDDHEETVVEKEQVQ